jgi:hypothetical protein
MLALSLGVTPVTVPAVVTVDTVTWAMLALVEKTPIC